MAGVAETKIEWKGLNEMSAALTEIGVKMSVQKRIFQKGIGPRAAGPRLAFEKTKQLIPVAAERYFRYIGGQKIRVRPGGLRRGLRIAALKSTRRVANFGSAIRTPTREQLGIPSGYKWYYPASLEYGWTPKRFKTKEQIGEQKQRKRYSGKRHVKGIAFMRRGLDENRDAIIGLIKRDIGVAIEDYFKKKVKRK